MIRHVAVFRWREGVTAEQVAAVSSALDGMPAAVPSIHTYHHGADLGLGSPRWDYAVVTDFDDEAGWRAYDTDPIHDQLGREVILPMAADRASIQLAL